MVNRDQCVASPKRALIDRRKEVESQGLFYVGTSCGDLTAVESRSEWKYPTVQGVGDFAPVSSGTTKKFKVPLKNSEAFIIVRRLVDWSTAVDSRSGLDFIYPDVQEVAKQSSTGIVDEEFANQLLVTNLDGPLVEVPRSWCMAMDASHLQGASDLLSLTQLSLASLLHSLRVRYRAGEIYTRVGSRILIAVNPYHLIKALVSDDVHRIYRSTASISDLSCLPPHPFALAHEAYLRMSLENKSQSLIISGESGAGKTETTKLILQHLATADSIRRSSESNENYNIERSLLQSNPVMESFGNAKTQRNDNSSRFGKFIRIFYDENLLINSTSVETYLLEKCRLTNFNAVETNYHVFYQMFRGLQYFSSDLVDKMRLTKFIDEPNDVVKSKLLGSFSLKECRAETFVAMQRAEQLSSLIVAMDILKIQHQDQLFELIAACLHLGELEFDEVDDGIQIRSCCHSSVDSFSLLVAHQGNDNVESLQRAICWKGITDVERGNLLMTPRPLSECYAVRDSIIRKLYNCVFSYIVNSINDSLSVGVAASDSIGIGLLDIYGFEVFGSQNSFEQLCINYANERLQRHFNHHVLEQEQVIYESEGIDWSHISFNDNLEVIVALDHKTSGVWSLLDSECQRPNGSDGNYNLMMRRHKSDVVGKTANRFLEDSHFEVLHYAGPVEYHSHEFLLKNRDALGADTTSYITECQNDILKVCLGRILTYDCSRRAEIL
eukprot:GHVH01008805.1.p1 GENE.GHVH01008805.1~~GHVH01008805.1.p1  ORF type:complete len:723 (-),score=106.87 GHVH01008805.1:1609-3777(-)